MDSDAPKLVHGIVYKHTNKINSHIYIGQTTQTLKQRMGEDFSGYARKNKNGEYFTFYYAILKYGPQNFTTDILFEGTVQQEVLDLLEQWFIFTYDTFKNGYNETTGGRGGKRSKDVCDKLSKINLKGKIKLTYTELYDLYIIQELTTTHIANMVGVKFGTINRWLKEYNIPIRSNTISHLKNHRKLTKEELINEYVVKNLSTRKISVLYDIAQSAVCTWLHEFNIPIKENERTKEIDNILTYELLNESYTMNGLTTKEIGKIYNISTNSVLRRLHKFNIPVLGRWPK
jgi:transposase